MGGSPSKEDFRNFDAKAHAERMAALGPMYLANAVASPPGSSLQSIKRGNTLFRNSTSLAVLPHPPALTLDAKLLCSDQSHLLVFWDVRRIQDDPVSRLTLRIDSAARFTQRLSAGQTALHCQWALPSPPAQKDSLSVVVRLESSPLPAESSTQDHHGSPPAQSGRSSSHEAPAGIQSYCVGPSADRTEATEYTFRRLKEGWRLVMEKYEPPQRPPSQNDSQNGSWNGSGPTNPNPASPARQAYVIDNLYISGGSEKECIVCLVEGVDTVLKPCNHLCLCHGCARELLRTQTACPICRVAIHSSAQVSFSPSP